MKQKYSKTILANLFISILIIIGVILAIIGYRNGLWNHLISFKIIAYSSILACVSFILFFIGLYKIKHSKKGLFLNYISLFLISPILFMTFMFTYNSKIYPPINDISTNTKNPPSFWDMPSSAQYPLKNISIQEEFYPNIQTLVISQTKKDAFNNALKIVQNNAWELIASDLDEGQIESVVSSFVFGFKDEVVIKITDDYQGATIDVRSRSRLGKIDRGVNAKRIAKFLKDLEEMNE